MNICVNKDEFDTLTEARAAYKEWADGCALLHWCLIPFDEWLYDFYKLDLMRKEIITMKEGK